MLQTLVVDNFFDDVNEIIKLSKKLKYYVRPKHENWPGLRTKSLHLTHYDLYNNIIVKILNYYYSGINIKYSNSFVHFNKLKYGDKGKYRFHRDEITKIAAVIYLDFDGDIKSGTTIFYDKKGRKKEKQIVVANKLNTMVAYDGQKYHGFTSLKNIKKERLTMTVFINEIEVLK